MEQKANTNRTAEAKSSQEPKRSSRIDYKKMSWNGKIQDTCTSRHQYDFDTNEPRIANSLFPLLFVKQGGK